MYGELKAESYLELFRMLQFHESAAPIVFADIGSGKGKIVVAAVWLFADIALAAYGIEVDMARHEALQTAQTRLLLMSRNAVRARVQTVMCKVR